MHTGHQKQRIGDVKLRELRVFPGEALHILGIFDGGWIWRVPQLKIVILSDLFDFKLIFGEITNTYPSFEQVAKYFPLCEKLTCSTWSMWSHKVSV